MKARSEAGVDLKPARDRLEDIVENGLIGHIFEAEEALALYDLIGRQSGSINEASFGHFFGRLQGFF